MSPPIEVLNKNFLRYQVQNCVPTPLPRGVSTYTKNFIEISPQIFWVILHTKKRTNKQSKRSHDPQTLSVITSLLCTYTTRRQNMYTVAPAEKKTCHDIDNFCFRNSQNTTDCSTSHMYYGCKVSQKLTYPQNATPCSSELTSSLSKYVLWLARRDICIPVCLLTGHADLTDTQLWWSGHISLVAFVKCTAYPWKVQHTVTH